jgi:hypothetical protein
MVREGSIGQAPALSKTLWKQWQDTIFNMLQKGTTWKVISSLEI